MTLDEDVQGIQFTPKGFRTTVALVLTGEAGEHVLEAREGSMLELANRVADRCRAICEAEQVEMSDAVYARAVDELAPQFAENGLP
jgi:hypothetical protein